MDSSAKSTCPLCTGSKVPDKIPSFFMLPYFTLF
jgi:hypothetical protein